MSGALKFLIGAVSLGLFCLTVIVSWLFIALWQMKELLGLILLGLLVLMVVVPLLVLVTGCLNEQSLRRKRTLYHHELPLDQLGRPLALPNYLTQTAYPSPVVVPYYQQGGPRYD